MPIAADGVGDAELDLRLTGPGLSAPQTFALGVDVGRARRLSRARVAASAARREARPSSTISLADFVPGTGSVASPPRPSARSTRRRCLQALDRYPYGCSEQTVSRAMPLLYANRLASARASRRRPRSRRAHQGGDRKGDDAAERQRRLRPVGGRQRRRRSLAGRLRDGFPDPGARARFRRAAARLRQRARPSAQRRRQRAPIPAKAARRSPMRSMCWPATAGR